ncbi:uncharacterized protein LOC132741009 [Ruditapes philippinarum]|uniref:uncharacterized protein LOC132741009 n=1 Tax=Ruditapes philippinarum TaxID=129788 RepID=UPI00295C02B5|nr:uncharacterized protein LOC132741009 [Ruditapes philippinarum]
MDQIFIGDVITIGNWFKSKTGVVSEVRKSPEGNDTNGQIKVIYCKFPIGFGRGTIVEETIELDPEKAIYNHDFSGCKVYEPEIVVQRAKQRLGEIQYGLTNLSRHFCHWAKVNEEQNDRDINEAEFGLQYVEELDPNNSNTNVHTIDVDHTRGRRHSSMSCGMIRAYIPNDVKEGLIVGYGRLLHRVAVCTKVEVDESCPSKRYICITVVHCGDLCKRKVREERLKFDLNVDRVYVYKYHPIYRRKTSDIITRAQALVGKNGEWTLFPASLEFARKIVVKENDQKVSKLDQLNQGDVIKCSSYRLFTHEALVTEVNKNANNLKIIHYTSNSILATRTVKEESIDVDLEKFPLYKKSYHGYVTYPANIAVARARSRLGERRYSINGNRSSDFVHWAKVVHHPAFVTKKSPSLSSSKSSNEESRVLLLPKAGQQYEEFQRFPAYVWSDLYPGVIVEYRYNFIWYRGILSHTDEKSKTIKVINYCTDRFLVTRTIKEYSINRDLQTQDIWIYKSHPFDCYEAGDVLKNARKRLGEQKWNFGRKSWNFCKECVLRKRSNDV